MGNSGRYRGGRMWSLVGTYDELVFLCDSMCLCVLCGKGFLDIRYQILDISWRVNFIIHASDELVFLCDSMCLCVLCCKGFLDISYQILDISWGVNFKIHASFAFFKLIHLIKGRLIGLTLRLNFPSTSTT